MADLTEQFEQAQQDVRKLDSRPGNTDLLALYAFYKQASVGDVKGKRPGFADLKGRAKYDAWAQLKGMDRDSAMSGYIDKVSTLFEAQR